MSKFLITGGAGFIGSNITIALLNKKHKVRILDNFSTGKKENIAGFRSKIDIIKGDIRNIKTVNAAVKGVDYVLHQAALPSVARSVADPATCNAVNVGGTLNVLLAARDHKVKRVVYAASSSAYGDTPVLPKVETMVSNPQSPYATAKLTGEFYCRNFAKIFNLETVCLRYFNVFGPKQDPTSFYSAVIPKFISAMLKGESPHINGDGRQSRDFTYIDNVVSANILACTAPHASGEVFNVACGKRYTVLELAEKIARILRMTLEPEFGPASPGDVKHSLADIRKAKKILKYSVKVDFDEGLRRTIHWFITGGK
ncbi:MAG: SDR family oxidoreductase [bacterium]|nr:SDR family oxidoreductase [bacterium]MDD5353584.1 SDR family oxidoreductase [bacterium]